MWVILFFDYLKAYIENISEIYMFDNKVIMCWFPPKINNLFQPNDTVIGRSVHTEICNLLYIWLKEEKNTEIWESKITAD